jgi:hypothetical protein
LEPDVGLLRNRRRRLSAENPAGFLGVCSEGALLGKAMGGRGDVALPVVLGLDSEAGDLIRDRLLFAEDIPGDPALRDSLGDPELAWVGNDL